MAHAAAGRNDAGVRDGVGLHGGRLEHAEPLGGRPCLSSPGVGIDHGRVRHDVRLDAGALHLAQPLCRVVSPSGLGKRINDAAERNQVGSQLGGLHPAYPLHGLVGLPGLRTRVDHAAKGKLRELDAHGLHPLEPRACTRHVSCLCGGINQGAHGHTAGLKLQDHAGKPIARCLRVPTLGPRLDQLAEGQLRRPHARADHVS
mmetsp:Transcript_112903/g.360622  ORF Transcript_112903/g.360622 Transcript_112903/m.360622 type:complete len:202 (+) Transcript_112903:784-1389(+)